MALARFRKIDKVWDKEKQCYMTRSGRFVVSEGRTGCDPTPYAEQVVNAKITPEMLKYLPTEDLAKIKDLDV